MKCTVFLSGLALLAVVVSTSNNTNEAAEPAARTTMSIPSVSLGYVILFVKDVSASLTFYEQAFGLSRRFFNDEGGKAYGELESGAACLAFANFEMAKAQLKHEFIAASPQGPPLGVEVALLTTDVPELYSRAVKAGAKSVSEPAKMPWGQTVAYVRDLDGHVIELCTPVTQ
jgi:lactoylglutathione lyase